MTTPVRAIFCVYDKPGIVGGPYSWILQLLPDLRSRGIDCSALVMLHTGEEGPVIKGLRDAGIPCDAVAAHPYTEDRVRWILERVRDRAPHIFVPNEIPAAYFAARWIREAGIPTVGVFHTSGKAFDAMRSLFVVGRRRDRLSAWVAVSRQIESEIATEDLDETNLVRIPCGSRIPTGTSERKNESFSFAYVGRLADEQKRITDLTRAFCMAVREVNGTSASIYGDGPDRASMEAILASEGAHLPVRWHGSIPSDRVIEVLQQHHAIVLLSDYEGLPMALMEGMACGNVPVCLKTESGIPELVRDGITGLMVSNRDGDFIRAIGHLATDIPMWNRLSAAARALIVAEYSHDVCADRWADLLVTMSEHAVDTKRVEVPRRLRLPRPDPAFDAKENRRPHVSMARRAVRRMRSSMSRVISKGVGAKRLSS
jgi:colanic acid/amylovoran biosynthesis glycosyltransferase